MRDKDYCTQNDGDCENCNLVNYGRDCLNIPLFVTDDEMEFNAAMDNSCNATKID